MSARRKPAIPLPEGHHHRWRLDEQNGPTTMGRCPCGVTRPFRASLDDIGSVSTWNSEIGKMAARRFKAGTS